MDLLRTCYTHKVFWDDAKTLSSTIIWYRCSDNAAWFPFPHVFSSERYDTVHWFNDGAGEDELTGPSYYNGVPPARFTGQAFCGDPDWYLGAPSDAPGLDLDENGWPICCNVEGGAYGYPAGPSSPTPPSSPSGPACNGCIDSIGPSVFKVTFTHLFAGCSVINGTWDLPYLGNCQWGALIPPGVGPPNVVLSLLPGNFAIYFSGLLGFTAPEIPYDCFSVSSWNPQNLPLCVTQGTIVLPPSTATVQPG